MNTATFEDWQTVTVPPSGNRWETVLLVLALAVMAGATAAYTATFGQEEPKQALLDWQISSFSGLTGVDQAIYNEMLVAAEEINWMLYYSGYWPDMPDFQEALLPPFYQDLSWQNNGSVQWQLKNVSQEGEAQGLTLYHGSHGTVDGQGAYLMVIDHKHAGNVQVIQPTLWWHENKAQGLPQHSTLSSIILDGWKQVMPYYGKDERDRLMGTDSH